MHVFKNEKKIDLKTLKKNKPKNKEKQKQKDKYINLSKGK